MAHIYELSSEKLDKLTNIEPMLDKHWQKVLLDVIRDLDSEGQDALNESIIAPKGIRFNQASQELSYQAPHSLKDKLSTTKISNPSLLQAIEDFQSILDSTPPVDGYDALLLAHEIEASLTHFDKTPTGQSRIEITQKNDIKKAFLYDLAQWVDNVSINVPKNVRHINQEILKLFIKQVFIKSHLHGYDFKYLEAVDLDLYEITHFPEFIKKEAMERKLLLVDTPSVWFLISPPENSEANPFSLHRFLYEENVGGGVFLNSLAMPKNMLDNPEAQRFFLMCIERIFSLDKNVDIEIKKFILNLKRIQKEQLEPILLDQNFSFDGSNTERVIAKRTVQFEEKLASLVLQKLPTMILIASKTEADREFLLRGMASFFDSISRLILRFQMHPLARRSFVARNLQIKILAYNRLLAKNKTWLFDATLSDEERAEPFTHAMQKIKDSYDEAIESDNQVDELIAEYRHYANKVESGSLWSKLGFGKPKYTLEELTEAKQSVSEEFLIEIFKIAKDYRQAMVFMEYETSFNADENFRHYAIANEKHYLTRLPYVISLPEDRTYFTLAGLADDINWQIFSQVDNV